MGTPDAVAPAAETAGAGSSTGRGGVGAWPERCRRRRRPPGRSRPPARSGTARGLAARGRSHGCVLSPRRAVNRLPCRMRNALRAWFTQPGTSGPGRTALEGVTLDACGRTSGTGTSTGRGPTTCSSWRWTPDRCPGRSVRCSSSTAHSARPSCAQTRATDRGDTAADVEARPHAAALRAADLGRRPRIPPSSGMCASCVARIPATRTQCGTSPSRRSGPGYPLHHPPWAVFTVTGLDGGSRRARRGVPPRARRRHRRTRPSRPAGRRRPTPHHREVGSSVVPPTGGGCSPTRSPGTGGADAPAGGCAGSGTPLTSCARPGPRAPRTSLNRPAGPRRACARSGQTWPPSMRPPTYTAERSTTWCSPPWAARWAHLLPDAASTSRSRGVRADLRADLRARAHRPDRLGNAVGVLPVAVPTPAHSLRGSPPSPAGPRAAVQRRGPLPGRCSMPGSGSSRPRACCRWLARPPAPGHHVRDEPARPRAAGHAPGRAAVDQVVPVTTTTGNVPVVFGALSYAGVLNLTVVADPDLPELDVLTADLRADSSRCVRPRRRFEGKTTARRDVTSVRPGRGARDRGRRSRSGAARECPPAPLLAETNCADHRCRRRLPTAKRCGTPPRRRAGRRR